MTRLSRLAPRATGLFLPVGLAVVAVAAGSALYGSLPGRPPERVRLSGTIEANRVVVSAKLAGRIAELQVDEGDRVTEGQIVARLDSQQLEAERRQQEERIRQLSSRLSQAEEQVALEQDRATGQVSQAEAQLRVVDGQLAQARAELQQARADAARLGDLASRQLVPPQQVEQADTAVKVAEAKVAALEDQSHAAAAGIELARADARQVSLARSAVEQIRAEQAEARARLAEVQSRLDDTTVKAPSAGTVSLRVSSQGEVIGAGEPIVTLVDLDRVWVRASVPESYVGQIALGQTLDVALASGEALRGTVTFVSPEPEFATERDVNRVKRDIRTFAVKVEVPNESGRIHPGMTAYVYLPDGSADRPADGSGVAAR